MLSNPYLDFFSTLPSSFRRDPFLPISAAELLSPDWLIWKAAIARHFAWAVPTEEAIALIRKHTRDVIEIGAGSGYWAWLMRQTGISVTAFDTDPPPFTWSEVARGDERAVLDHPHDTLFLCWPPWDTDMAFNALDSHRGGQFIYVGEWMGGNANTRFFTLLASQFKAIDSIAIPRWYMRNDFLAVFHRREGEHTSGASVRDG